MCTQLFKEYERRKTEIKAKLERYRLRGLHATDEEIFEVMCLCTCSPQTDYMGVKSAIAELKRSGLLFSGCTEEIALCLKKHKVSYHNRKANYICEARSEFFGDHAKIELRVIVDALRSEEPIPRRQKLRKAMKGCGLGMKEISEFLRNLGLGSDYAILDSRILSRLQRCGVITEIPKRLTKRKYLEIEQKMREWAQKIDILLDELDILLWH